MSKISYMYTSDLLNLGEIYENTSCYSFLIFISDREHSQ